MNKKKPAPPRVGRTPDILRKGGPHPRQRYVPEIDWDEIFDEIFGSRIMPPSQKGEDE